MQISLGCKRIREIHVRLREFRIQFHGGPEVSDRGIDLSLGEQNPTERVVTLRALGGKPQHPLKGGARRSQITLMQRRHTLLVVAVAREAESAFEESADCAAHITAAAQKKNSSALQSWKKGVR